MIIKSLLSQDLYKLTMLQLFFYEFPDVMAKYKFKCRSANINLLPFKKEIEEEIDALCELKLTTEEIKYLNSLSFIFPEFIDYLEDYKMKRDYIHVGEKDGNLDIVMEGPITRVSPFEIYVLKIVHEVYSKKVNPPNEIIISEGRERLIHKIRIFKEFEKENGYTPKIAEFGGRRAYTTEWHDFVTRNLAENGIIIGTSDVNLARRLNITPVGTMAHECCQLPQGFTHILDSQTFAFKTWLNFYGNDLGILLSDTLGDKKFLLDFTPEIAHRSFGVRQDSGCPFQFGEMIISHYLALGIDPLTKTIVFSDSLDFPKIFQLEKKFHGRIKTMYGCGTNLSNDLGIKPLQNVIKLVEVNNRPVIKLSNDIGKCMCEDENYMNYVKNTLKSL